MMAFPMVLVLVLVALGCGKLVLVLLAASYVSFHVFCFLSAY